MRSYGAKKATEVTRKQIGVIFCLAKQGKLRVEKGKMTSLYDLAEYYGYDDNGSVAEEESYAKDILNDIFSGNIEAAQLKIDRLSKSTFESLSKKNQQRWCKEFV